MTDERVRRERRRVKRLAAGLCAKCGKLPHRPGVQTCVSCFEKQKEQDRKKYLRKAAEKKLERRESEKPNTICIDCKHAVPTADGKYGCEWSRHFQPVTGWVAVRRDLKVQGGAGKVHFSLSYKVESCPKFIEG